MVDPRDGDEVDHYDGAVVVGVDGSEASVDALRWGARYARLTASPLRVVTAWCFPEHPAPFGIVPDIPVPAGELDVVHGRLDDLTRGVVGEVDGLDVRTRVIAGDAVSVLLEAAGGAQLLVVGSRGRGAFAGMLLGSVSDHCVRHAACPVVVVRHASS